jgi:TonB family protein
MSILKTIVPKPGRLFAPPLRESSPRDRRQRELMIGSLCILLLALGILLWHDRDFWIPPDDADVDQPVEVPLVVHTPTPKATPAPAANVAPAAQPNRKIEHRQAKLHAPSPSVQTATNAAPNNDDDSGITVTNRTVLPPLDVEVVAGDTRRVIKPGNNSLHVDLQPAPVPQAATEAPEPEITANVTTNAAERVEISANASNIVASPTSPSYPLLARQMRVQGRVVLLALIGKDGIIQNLHLVSGPPILAAAAEDAVRQWHFKPHVERNEALETQARITVNFTISTN